MAAACDLPDDRLENYVLLLFEKNPCGCHMCELFFMFFSRFPQTVFLLHVTRKT